MMGQKLRILYLHPTLEIGGAEELRYTLLSRLDRSRYEARLCCIQRKGRIGEEIEALGFPVDVLNRSIRTASLGTTWAVYRYLRAHPADVIQTSLFGANWHGRIAGWLARVPVMIAEEHCVHDEAEGNVRYNPNAGWFFRMMDAGLARITDRIIACSNAVARSIAEEERIPLEKFLSLPNVVDPERFRPSGEREAARQELGYGAEHVVAVSVGTLKPGKGLQELMAAFARAQAALPALRLLLIGDGPWRARVEAWRDDQRLGPYVTLLGAQRDVSRWLSAADLFVSASLSEGFGLSTLEAMAMGLPCVATRVGGVPEVVLDGQTGLIVPPADVPAMADALRRLAGDPALGRRLGMAGAQRVKEAFLPQRYVEGLSALYEDTVAAKTPATNGHHASR